jgi:hypothetical protein
VLTDLRALLNPLLADNGVTLVPAQANGAHDAGPEASSNVTEQPDAAQPAEEPPADEDAAGPGRELATQSREVQIPGHLRGARSAAFLTPRQEPLEVRQADTLVRLDPADAASPGEGLLRGAELLMVGTGEEEAW